MRTVMMTVCVLFLGQQQVSEAQSLAEASRAARAEGRVGQVTEAGPVASPYRQMLADAAALVRLADTRQAREDRVRMRRWAEREAAATVRWLDRQPAPAPPVVLPWWAWR